MKLYIIYLAALHCSSNTGPTNNDTDKDRNPLLHNVRKPIYTLTRNNLAPSTSETSFSGKEVKKNNFEEELNLVISAQPRGRRELEIQKQADTPDLRRDDSSCLCKGVEHTCVGWGWLCG